jgi:hypothetical protein
LEEANQQERKNTSLHKGEISMFESRKEAIHAFLEHEGVDSRKLTDTSHLSPIQKGKTDFYFLECMLDGYDDAEFLEEFPESHRTLHRRKIRIYNILRIEKGARELVLRYVQFIENFAIQKNRKIKRATAQAKK